MDLIFIIALFAIIFIIYRDSKFLVYFVCMLEIFFRLVHYVGDNIHFININSFINRYIPSSLFSLFAEYTSGIVYDIICWVLVFVFFVFLGYLVTYFIRKK